MCRQLLSCKHPSPCRNLLLVCSLTWQVHEDDVRLCRPGAATRAASAVHQSAWRRCECSRAGSSWLRVPSWQRQHLSAPAGLISSCRAAAAPLSRPHPPVRSQPMRLFRETRIEMLEVRANPCWCCCGAFSGLRCCGPGPLCCVLHACCAACSMLLLLSCLRSLCPMHAPHLSHYFPIACCRSSKPRRWRQLSR